MPDLRPRVERLPPFRLLEGRFLKGRFPRAAAAGVQPLHHLARADRAWFGLCAPLAQFLGRLALGGAQLGNESRVLRLGIPTNEGNEYRYDKLEMISAKYLLLS